MKKALILLVCFLSFKCVTVGSVKDISGSHILNGDEKGKNEIEKANKFAFQIHKNEEVFRRYLNKRYKDVVAFTPDYFNVEINNVSFNIQLLTEKDLSTTIDFTDVIFKRKNPEIIKKGKTKRFVFFVVTDQEGKDCLKTESFYRYIVTNYLEDIRQGFFSY
ncbi:hypothetical protein [uncultured Lacinutrix sp.]|uniref:hypothetical protein n=1 Tax=uncultured Lacinutrix sp. TaxID=574032 RepID=UPI0026176E16|nr:hypothetical protein [uncultured Lacinutrix sp.]